MNECTCPVEHTVTKLGHIRSCPFYGTVPPPVFEDIRRCGDVGHTDGTPHDFGWASYEGENTGTGVCRCGMTAITWSMMTWP